MFDKLPNELKDLGMTPAEIAQAVKDAKDLKARQSTLEGELSTTKTALDSATSSFNETKQRLDALEANPPQRRVEPQNSQPADIEYLDDMDGAVQQRIARATGPVALVALQAARNTARMMAINSLQGQVLETSTGRISMRTLWE